MDGDSVTKWLVDDEVVPYQPTLGMALGSPVRALIVQALWSARNITTGVTEMGEVALSVHVGTRLRTVEFHLALLVEMGVVERVARPRHGMTAFVVHPEAIPDTFPEDELPVLSSRAPAHAVPYDAHAGLEGSSNEEPTTLSKDLSKDSFSTSKVSDTREDTEDARETKIQSLNLPHETLLGRLPEPPDWVKMLSWMNPETWRIAVTRARHVSVLEQIENVSMWAKDNGKTASPSLLMTFIHKAETEWEQAHQAVPGDDDWVARSARELMRQALAAREGD